MTLYRARTFDILEGAQEFPAVGLLGSRQSGKTTLSQLMFKNHAYVSLEDIELRAAATIDPRTFLESNRNNSGLIIDEFQYVPELLSYIESERESSGTYIVCGPHNSYTQELLIGYLEGRVSIHTLLPLSIRELTKNYLLPERVETVLYNGLHPGSYIAGADPQALYRKFLSTYIDRDVHQHGQVDNVTTFHTFLTQCALHVGQVLNITTLANASGISDHTARRWVSLLEDHKILFLVKPYHTDFGKRLIKSPKLYFYDPGVICSLLKIKEGDLPKHPLKNKLFETLIMSELMKWSHHTSTQLYFWKDKTDHEIECLLEDTDVIPITIKSGTLDTFTRDLAYWHKISNSTQQGYSIVPASKPPHTEDVLRTNLSWSFLQPLYTRIQNS